MILYTSDLTLTVGFFEAIEATALTFEAKVHLTKRTISVLGNRKLDVFEVVLIFSVKKHYYISVLLNCAGFAKIG